MVPARQKQKISSLVQLEQQHIQINGEREAPGRRKVARGSNVSVLTSHVGQNPHSCTALSLTASLVSLCEAWLRAGTASYQRRTGTPRLTKVVRGSNVPVLTSHAGLNPRSCTTLSLAASFVSLCEAWLRARSESYQKEPKKRRRYVIYIYFFFLWFNKSYILLSIK